ncbi:MAG: (d)CMP kinase [Eubacteriales bacterium]|nr:(d)CMP kinase [Eubacteriales bacterium]
MKQTAGAVHSIALDGPAGAGKSTIAKSLARRLSYIYVDTGAMYRALSVYFLSLGLDPDDEKGISEAVGAAEVGIVYRDGQQHVLLNGTDVTDRLRTEEVSDMASRSSAYAAVRAHLLSLQRGLAKTQNVIMDGRDIGTVVLPCATLKVFLTASPAVRAKRRYDQLVSQGILNGATLSEIEADIRARDYRDSHRENAPLKQAEDAVLLDSSSLNAEEVQTEIIRLLEERVGHECE